MELISNFSYRHLLELNDLFEKPIDFLYSIHFKHKSLLFNEKELEFNI
jgi:hypothetical protein